MTIAAVTIFLHRAQAHRALDLPSRGVPFLPPVAVADHRDGYPRVGGHSPPSITRNETAEDPHSPMVYGHWGVLRFGVDLYRKEAKNAETISPLWLRHPDDWMERNVYGKYTWQGMGVSLIIFFTLFGFAGLAIMGDPARLDSDYRRRHHQQHRPLLGLSQLLDRRYLDQHQSDRHHHRR